MTEENKPEAPNSSDAEASPASQPRNAHAAAGEAKQASAPPPPDPLAEAQAEAARYKDQLLRTAADFDNFRKRTRRELEDAERRGRDDLLKEFLPVFDNLERATAHASQTDATGGVKALADGISLVIRQFVDTLRKLGIERIESVGKQFDPGQHEAIQHLETAEFAPGIIAAEVQAGYRSGERLVRPALVVVAKRPAAVVSDVSESSGQSSATPED